MAHFAELNELNEVIYVAYLDNEIITDRDGNEIEQLGIYHLQHHHGMDRRWVRTSYSGNFRGKYACIGDTYREDFDIFISPQPYSSWSLNEINGEWESPSGPAPTLTESQIDSNSFYRWNEGNKEWVLETLIKSEEL